MKKPVSETCQMGKNLHGAAEALCLKPDCSEAVLEYLECFGLQDPYHDRDHEILGASYEYLRTVWPASEYREQVIAALRGQLDVATSKLKRWITPDSNGWYHASTRQMIAASRILWDLRYDEKPIAIAVATSDRIATALGSVLSNEKIIKNNARYGEFAALELLDSMGPCAAASLPFLLKFTCAELHLDFPQYVFKTLVSIRSRSKKSLSVILNTLRYCSVSVGEMDRASKMFAHAGQALMSLFGVDSKHTSLLDYTLQNQVSRGQLVRSLENCESELVAERVERFLISHIF